MPTVSAADAIQQTDWFRFLQRPAKPSYGSDSRELIEGKTILITGAGGSIGSALARLLIAGPRHELVLLDRSKENLNLVYQRCRNRGATQPEVSFIEGNIFDRGLLEKLFAQYEPHIVFHAAALKHLVPLESDVFAALESNTFATADLLSMATRFGVAHFVNLSTDKAVTPTSVLGVSKRISELLLMAHRQAGMQITSLRLGNVLGSSGSVASIFLQRLMGRLPLEITHPEASRYFLTLEEGASILLQSLALRDSRLLVPEMGAARKITELARFLQQEFGAEDSEPPVVIGLRDGEKLCEQLTYDFEYLKATSVAQIYEVCGTQLDPDLFLSGFVQLRALVEGRNQDILDTLLNLVPEFVPSTTLARCLEA